MTDTHSSAGPTFRVWVDFTRSFPDEPGPEAVEITATVAVAGAKQSRRPQAGGTVCELTFAGPLEERHSPETTHQAARVAGTQGNFTNPRWFTGWIEHYPAPPDTTLTLFGL